MTIEKEIIYLVPLLKELGYLQVKLKLVRATHIFGANLIYVSTYHYNEIPAKNKISDFLDDNLLLSPLTMLLLPGVKGLDKWIKLKNIEPNNKDFKVPDFREMWGLPLFIDENEDNQEWLLVKSLNLNDRIPYNYEQLKHLGYYELLTQRLLNIRLTMEWLKSQGKAIEDYFTKEELEDHYYKRMYSRVKNSLQYEEIPVEKRSKF